MMIDQKKNIIVKLIHLSISIENKHLQKIYDYKILGILL